MNQPNTYAAHYRIPPAKRWKSAGTYATVAEARAALERIVQKLKTRCIDKWVQTHRQPNGGNQHG